MTDDYTIHKLRQRFPRVGGQAINQARRMYLNSLERNACEVVVRFGATGTLKTTNAIHNDFVGTPHYVKVCSKGNKWFCDYDGERKIILDEVRAIQK